MELTLEDVNVGEMAAGRWRKTPPGTWVVREADEKLCAKYQTGTTTVFDWYVFHYPHREPNRITPVDIAAADRLMNAQVSRKGSRWKALTRQRRADEVANALAEIPIGADILEPRYDGSVARAFKALRTHDIQLAIASKLLTIKRPHLIPMLDSVVADCLGTRDPSILLQKFRRLLTHPQSRKVAEDLARLVQVRFSIEISLVRVLDQLIWFDWNLRRRRNTRVYEVQGFEEWTYRVGMNDRGVSRK